MNRLPVVAAIPNYNMGEQLNELLPCVLAAGYDDIYVLDDNSTDGSHDITQSVSTDIHFVSNGENKGAGANRNRILQALRHEATIHFLDADTNLETERAAEAVADAVPTHEYGFIGGLAKTQAGFQTVWNYGPRQSLWASAGANLQTYIEPLLETDPEKAARIHKRFAKLLADWPDPQSSPIRRQVYWVVEQNMVVNSRIFAEIGGFDEALREHEIQDLAIRMASRGLKRYFDPTFSITHKAVDVRHYNRLTARLKDELKINRKHGLGQWVRPGGSFKPAL